MRRAGKKMKGHNQVWLSGYVGGKILFSSTRAGEPAFSFAISSGEGHESSIWVRVNAYGPIAIECRDNLNKGAYCQVLGELMNRNGKYGELTEVRAKDVVIYAEM